MVTRDKDKKCSTCRYWSPAPNGITWYEEHDDDPNYIDAEHTSEHHNCVAIVHGNRCCEYGPSEPPEFRELAIVTDGSGYAASLRTLANFSCALWKGKD